MAGEKNLEPVKIEKSDYASLPKKEEVLKAVFIKINCLGELTPGEAALVEALLQFADRLF